MDIPPIKYISLCLLQMFWYSQTGLASTWSEWWSYKGISGPDFWGLVNPEWNLCSKGRLQSPINIDPKQLLYDPNLKHLHVDKHRMSGVLMNTGHDIRLVLDESEKKKINISGGPLLYQYRISEIIIHFGSNDSIGSEHSIDKQFFPAEIQIVGYNTDLYGNMTQATYSTNGLTMVAILVQVGRKSNVDFDIIAQNFKQVRFKGKQVRIRDISVHALLPTTDDVITYEGSMTQPGCHETVTWIILNKPLYITYKQLRSMRDIMRIEENKPNMTMDNNSRKTMHLNGRPVRTNINFPKSPVSETKSGSATCGGNSLDIGASFHIVGFIVAELLYWTETTQWL